MHDWLRLDYFRYMVTCKSSKSRTSLDLGGHGGVWTGTERTLARDIHASQNTFSSNWSSDEKLLDILAPSTPLARPRLHHFKLLFRLSCNFMRFFVKTLENWWSKHLFLKSLLLSLNLCESRILVRFYIESPNPIPPHGVQYCPLIVMYTTTALQKCKNILHRIACFWYFVFGG